MFLASCLNAPPLSGTFAAMNFSINSDDADEEAVESSFIALSLLERTDEIAALKSEIAGLKAKLSGSGGQSRSVAASTACSETQTDATYMPAGVLRAAMR